MKIETTHNGGDKVWFIHENKAKNESIRAIHVTVRIVLNADHQPVELVTTAYTIEINRKDVIFRDNELFKTKEELLKSL